MYYKLLCSQTQKSEPPTAVSPVACDEPPYWLTNQFSVGQLGVLQCPAGCGRRFAPPKRRSAARSCGPSRWLALPTTGCFRG